MKRYKNRWMPGSLMTVVLLGVLALRGFSEVIVVNDPKLNDGVKAISNSRRLTEAEGSVSENVLEALPGFSGIGDFAFDGNESSKTEYIFNFTDNQLADFRLRYSGGVLPATVNVTTATYTTSRGSSMRFQAGGSNRSVKLRIDAGTYASEGFVADKGLKALAFALCLSASKTQIDIDISYFDRSNKLLSRQTVQNSISEPTGWYTGYLSEDAPIAYVVISYTSGASALIVTLDDLSFAAAQ